MTSFDDWWSEISSAATVLTPDDESAARVGFDAGLNSALTRYGAMREERDDYKQAWARDVARARENEATLTAQVREARRLLAVSRSTRLHAPLCVCIDCEDVHEFLTADGGERLAASFPSTGVGPMADVERQWSHLDVGRCCGHVLAMHCGDAAPACDGFGCKCKMYLRPVAPEVAAGTGTLAPGEAPKGPFPPNKGDVWHLYPYRGCPIHGDPAAAPVEPPKETT